MHLHTDQTDLVVVEYIRMLIWSILHHIISTYKGLVKKYSLADNG